MNTDDERWLLSYYRHSELNGALFFGRLARTVRGPLQGDLTRHFADESRHAHWWTETLDALGTRPARVAGAYQDQYLEAAGLPANLMEILAITHVFERRAAGQYARHARRADVQPEVRATLRRILQDEVRHLAWVRCALREMGPEFGAATVRATLARCEAADREVYRSTLEEYEERSP
jgi:hypothetical protein